MSAHPAPLRKPLSPTQQTLQAIKGYILDAHLMPGDPLPTEAQMCSLFGISRSSVREAIRTLCALDIVEVRHGYGTFVGEVSMQPMIESLVFRGMLNPGDDHRVLHDIVELRQNLDHAFAPQVIAAWKDADDAAGEPLEAAVVEMEHLADKGESFSEADRRFHSLLLAPLSNHLYSQLVEGFWDVHARIVPTLQAATMSDSLATAEAHRAIWEAVKAGDVEALHVALDQHYGPIREKF